jgi:hypothetical protein
MGTGSLQFQNLANSDVAAKLILITGERTGIGFANRRVQIVHNSALGETLSTKRFELKAVLIPSEVQEIH